MQEDALSKGQKVMIVDDLIATGGEIYFCQKLFIKSDHFLPYQVHQKQPASWCIKVTALCLAAWWLLSLLD